MGITLNDIAEQRAMLARGEEKRKADWKQAERERLRDHFAAAAMVGLLTNIATERTADRDDLAWMAYAQADAMLRERSRAGQKMAESDSFCAACPERESTNHDAAPAARAPADSCVPRRAVDCDSDGTDKADPLTRDCGTGDISEAQIDALECVVEDGRIVGMSVYGHLRSLLVRLRPEWESDRPKPVKDCDSDRSKPINDDRLAALEELSAMDQELELKHGITGNPMIKAQVNNHPVSYAQSDDKRVFYDMKNPRNGALSGCETVPDPDSRVWETPCTPQPHATPPQGNVQGEGSFRDSQNAKEPVAWAVMERDGFGIECTFTDRDEAAEWCDSRQQIVPLYRHPQPTLTDEEREAVEHGLERLELHSDTESRNSAMTLRKLLDRIGGDT